MHGQYLAIGGKAITYFVYHIRIFGCKKWEEIAKFDGNFCFKIGHSNTVSSVKFGKLAKFIVSSSYDGNLNIYTPS